MSDLAGIFPDEIVTKILTCLTAKTICRFKCVSKAWKSIICHPHFLSSYISRCSLSWTIFERFIGVNLESATELNLQWQQPPDVSVVSLNPRKLDDEPTELIEGSKLPASLVSSSNGFLLFLIKNHTAPPSFSWVGTLGSERVGFVVVNPITHEWVLIPKPPEDIKSVHSVGFVTQICDETGVLKKFLIAEYCGKMGPYASIMRFSSETWSWEVFRATHEYTLPWFCRSTREFEGHLLWFDVLIGILTWDEPYSDNNAVAISTWDDLFDRDRASIVCRQIEPPRPMLDYKDFWVNSWCIDVVAGYIHLAEVAGLGNHEFSLWRLSDYYHGEWTLLYRFDFKDVWSVNSYSSYGLEKVMPKLCFIDPFEADVVIIKVGNKLCSFNALAREVEKCATYNCSLDEGLPNLVQVKLPNWPAPISPSLKATFLREHGNNYFMAENFNEAIKCYSRSIALSSSTMAYVNRGITYLKVNRYTEAETDCSEALKIDDQFFMAFKVLATARLELENLIGYIEDVEAALKLKPEDQEIVKRYAEVKSLIEKATSGRPVLTAPPIQNDPSVLQEDISVGDCQPEGAALQTSKDGA